MGCSDCVRFRKAAGGAPRAMEAGGGTERAHGPAGGGCCNPCSAIRQMNSHPVVASLHGPVSQRAVKVGARGDRRCGSEERHSAGGYTVAHARHVPNLRRRVGIPRHILAHGRTTRSMAPPVGGDRQFHDFTLHVAMAERPAPQGRCGTMQVVALRLHPGEETKSALMAEVKAQGLGAAYVASCVGSVRRATLRMAHATAESRNEVRSDRGGCFTARRWADGRATTAA